MGSYQLSEITPNLVREWIATLNMSPKSVNNVLIPLRAIFRDAYENEILDKNPMDRIRALPVKSREPTPFTRAETSKIIAELYQSSLEIGAYFDIAFLTGLRTGELLALEWTDVDFERRKLAVTKAKSRGQVKPPKTRAGRRFVDLCDHALSVLKELRHATDGKKAVFCDPATGSPWKNEQRLRRCFRYPALDKARVSRMEPYQTRHTFASHRLSQGENPMYVAQQMGHSNWGMIIRVYGRYIPPASTNTRELNNEN